MEQLVIRLQCSVTRVSGVRKREMVRSESELDLPPYRRANKAMFMFLTTDDRATLRRLNQVHLPCLSRQGLEKLSFLDVSRVRPSPGI
jgi:hypothetical protein